MKQLSIFLNGFRIDRAIGFVWLAAAKWTVVSIILLIAQTTATLSVLFIFKLIVDHLTNSSTDAIFNNLLVLIGIALGVTIIGNLCNALAGYTSTMQTHLVADHMQHLVQLKSIDLDLAYYENSQSYDKLHRAQREAPARPLRIIQSLTELGRNGLTLLGALALLLTFHWGVVVAVLVASLPVLVYRLKQADDLYRLHREKTASERLSGYFNQVITTATSAKEVRAFGFGPLMIHRFGELRSKIRASLQHLSAQGYRRQFITESAATLAGYGALAFVAHAAVRKSISLGEMVMYFGAFQVAVGSLRPTLSALAELYENNLFLSTLYEFLAVQKQVPEPVQPKEMPRPWQSGLRVENLGFRYPDTNRWVLDGITLTIHPGQIVALVGRNGSGKTTLTKLLCRLYDPDTGQISIDDIDLRDFKTADLRREISVIHQDFGRYHMTARENIMLGCPDIGSEDPAIVQAAQWADIHENLIRLPKGYETVMSRTFADGVELSIGQWQKLALARAFVRDSQLILLDEPTSSLDAAAEFEFFEKFREMAHGRSALIISHRFSTVRLADCIYVLDEGHLIEQGNHEDLMVLDGLYAHLYRQQASYYRDESQPTNVNK
ncbi:MAG: ABC transporter ATP-binding protein [Candidatus Competibacteraceae bacterium]|nr:ABC transporter ATP-binding protein [Candidatus Competibacteraceae bacterium]